VERSSTERSQPLATVGKCGGIEGGCNRRKRSRLTAAQQRAVDIERHLVACIEVGDVREGTRSRDDVVASAMQLGGEGVPRSTRRARDQYASSIHRGHVTASEQILRVQAARVQARKQHPRDRRDPAFGHPIALRAMGRTALLPCSQERQLRWSFYGAQRSQLVATDGKWNGGEEGSEERKPLPWVATSCLRRSMVRRGSTVRVRQRALQRRRQSALLVQVDLHSGPSGTRTAIELASYQVWRGPACGNRSDQPSARA
jgi:hypothetical protein